MTIELRPLGTVYSTFDPYTYQERMADTIYVIEQDGTFNGKYFVEQKRSGYRTRIQIVKGFETGE